MLPLITRSKNSLGRSLQDYRDIVDFAVKSGAPAAALTDVHSLSAIPHFLEYCKEKSIHGIAGMTINVTNNDNINGELVLLAKGDVGYQALVDIHRITGDVGDDNKFNPARGLSWDNMLRGEYDALLKHCVALDGFPGSLAQSVMQSQKKMMVANEIQEQLEDPQSLLSRLRYRFSPDDYLGVKPPGQSSALASVLSSTPDGDGHIRQHPPCAVESLLGYAKNEAQLSQGKALLAHYTQDYISKKITASSSDELRKKIVRIIDKKYSHCHLESAGKHFIPSPGNFISDAALMARCQTPSAVLRRGVAFDVIDDVPINFDERVRALWANFKKLLNPNDVERYRRAVKEEIDIIKATGFESYFVNIFQFHALSVREQNDMMLRGSAVSSLIFHMAGMSDIDPVKEGLLFRRFLSPERVEEPDVDMDIAQPSEMLNALNQGPSRGNFGTIMNYNGLKSLAQRFGLAKNALLDFYNIDPAKKAEIKEIAAVLTRELGRKKSDMVAWKSDVWPALPEKVRRSPISKALVGIAENIGAARMSTSRSSTGVVISKSGFDAYPQIAAKDQPWPSIAFDKSELGALGLVKYDFLANRYLTRNVNALRLAGVNPNIKVSPYDPSARFVFSRGALLGLTQMNGFMAPKLYEQIKPSNFYEISAMSAMLRDGGDPNFQSIVDQYVQGKRQPDNIRLPDVAKSILSDTYGALYYEEQLLTLMTEVGGISMTEADRLRSGIKKKNYGLIDKMRGPFMAGAQQRHGLSEEESASIYALVEGKRGRYLFNKAHSMAYASLCMKEVWTKCHYPAEFYAESLMDNRFTPSAFLVHTLIPDEKNDATAKMVNRIATLMNDWRKIAGAGRPDGDDLSKRFVRAIGKIAVRDMPFKHRHTVRNYSGIQGALIKFIDLGGMDFIIPQNGEREALKAFCGSVFDFVSEKLAVNTPSAPLVAGQKKHSQKDTSGQGIDGLHVQEEPSGIAPLNRREKRYLNYKDFKEIPFPAMLDFLDKEGLLSLVETKDDGGGRAVYIFAYQDHEGKMHHEKVKAMTTDPSKMGEYSSPIFKAMFQGGDKNQQSITSQELFYFTVSQKHNVDWPQPILSKSERGFFRIEYDKQDRESAINKQNQAFYRVAHKYLLQAKTPLHDRLSMGLVSKREILEPSAPVINAEFLFKGEKATSEGHIESLFSETRAIPKRELQRQIKDGSLSPSKSWSDSWTTPKKGKDKRPYRRSSLEPLSNHRLVSDTVPLYQMTPNPGVGIAEGGHQRFYFRVDKGRAGKMDLNKTTKSKRGAVCGRIEQGAETLWLTEATIDTFSFNELQVRVGELIARRPDLKGMPVAEPNSLSVRSAGMAKVFIEELLSIRVIDNTKNGGGIDFCEVVKSKDPKPMSDGTKESLREWFDAHSVHWYSNGSHEDKEAKCKLAALMKEAGMSADEIKKAVVTHQRKENDSDAFAIHEIFKSAINKPGDAFLSVHNIDNWLNSCGLDVVQSPQGDFIAGDKNTDLQRGESFLSLSENEKQQVRMRLQQKFTLLTGAKSLGMALDADIKDGIPGAGRIDAKITADVCRLIGIPVGSFMPEPQKGREYVVNGIHVSTPKDAKGRDDGLKDHNDYLMFITALENAGGQKEADAVLLQYAEALVMPALKPDVPAVNVKKRYRATPVNA
ncbi:PHP domain-containing protein [Alteromonas sp. 14N.309.X.WAT.G.H12]|uniref:PHP domain-containing protein n=1 Tax=Alteromonas sp. 14N.309.X.WAT.G.H12 TaxID=3120824 RepID=UPI002FD09CBE